MGWDSIVSKFGNDDGSNSNGRKDNQTSLNGFRLDSTQSSWLMDRLGALDAEDKISMSGAPQAKQEDPHYDDPDWQQEQQQGGYQGETSDAEDRVVVVPPEVFSQNNHYPENNQHVGGDRVGGGHSEIAQGRYADETARRDEPDHEQYMSSDDGQNRGRQPGVVPGRPLSPQRPAHPEGHTRGHPHGQEGRQPHPGSRGIAPQGPGPQDVAGYQGQRPQGGAGSQLPSGGQGGYEKQVPYQLTEQERARIAQMGQQNNEDPEILKQKIEELEKQLAEISQLTEEEKAGYVEGLIYRGVARNQTPAVQEPVHETAQEEILNQDAHYYDEHHADDYGHQERYHQSAQEQRAQDQRLQELAEMRQAGYEQAGYRDDYEQSSHVPYDDRRGYGDDTQYGDYQRGGEYGHGEAAQEAGQRPVANEILQDERRDVSSENQLQMEPDYGYQQQREEEQQQYRQGHGEQPEHDQYEMPAQQQLSQQEYGTLPQFLAPLPQEKKFRPAYLSIVGSVCALAIVGGVAYNYLGSGVSDVIKGDLSGLGVTSVDKFADQVGDDNSARLGTTEKEMVAPPVKEAEIELAGVPSGLKQSFIVDPVVGVAGKDASIDVKLPSGVALDAAFIVLRDLPAWTKLSSGRQMNGLWMVSASQVPSLKMSVPADKHGNFSFEVDLIVSAGETPITRKVLAEISSSTGEAEVAVAARDPLSPQPEMIKPPEAVTNKGPLIIDQALEEKWLERGTRLLRAGDVSAARLAFSHLAEQGSGRAALAMGMTYDPNQPSSRIVSGLKPDRKRAKFWYQRALSLGNEAARSSLRQLEIEK